MGYGRGHGIRSSQLIEATLSTLGTSAQELIHLSSANHDDAVSHSSSIESSAYILVLVVHLVHVLLHCPNELVAQPVILHSSDSERIA